MSEFYVNKFSSQLKDFIVVNLNFSKWKFLIVPMTKVNMSFQTMWKFSKSIYLTLTSLICLDKSSRFSSFPGLLPHVWSAMSSSAEYIYCNISQPYNISIMQHKFVTILLTVNADDDILSFHMHFSVNTNTNPEKIHMYQNIYERISASYPRPSMVLTGDIIPKSDHRWMNDLTISRLRYKGYHRNLQHSHVYDITAMNNKKLMFPKGMYCANVYRVLRLFYIWQ